ncbi:hypothetical protein Hanom_Chr07g00629791 [Helianthus anomalus]
MWNIIKNELPCVNFIRIMKGEYSTFITLWDVKNTGEMEKSLSSIRMGEYKLSCNVARFTLEKGEINNRQPEITKSKPATVFNGISFRGKEAIGETRMGMNPLRMLFWVDPTRLKTRR